MSQTIDPAEALQVAIAATLLADANVAAIVGGAVYAHGSFSDDWPRVTLGTPQVLGADNTCSPMSDCFVTVHSWARGPDCTLLAGRLAGAVRQALGALLTVEGHRVVTYRFHSADPIGDPDPLVEHVASLFRYQTLPAG